MKQMAETVGLEYIFMVNGGMGREAESTIENAGKILLIAYKLNDKPSFIEGLKAKMKEQGVNLGNVLEIKKLIVQVDEGKVPMREFQERVVKAAVKHVEEALLQKALNT